MAVTVEVKTEDEGEEADYFVCIPVTDPLSFPDNVVDVCCKCGAAIQHRPHFPVTPRKVCWSCIQPDMERQAAKDDLNIMITPHTAQEVAGYLRKKNAN
jgi:hypothetical protein